MSLPRQVRQGLAWSGGSRLVGQLLQLGSNIVLARLLTPRDFGLAATVYLFAGVASLLAEMGIGSALVRKRTLSQADLDTAFWINGGVGLLLTLVLAGLAPVIALLYDAPELLALTLFIACRFSLSLYVVPLALLERAMDFGRIARIDVAAFLLGAAAAVLAALAGAGYYSLVVSPLVQAVVQSVLFFSVTRFRPLGFVQRRAAQELWSYSSRYALANLLTYCRYNADGFAVGKALGQVQLGYYGRGIVLVSLPLQQITYVLHRVMLPTLTRLRDQPDRLRRAFLSTVGTLGVIAGLGMTLLAVTAEHLVPFVWGGQWLPVVPIVAWLALAGAFQVLGSPTSWLCELEGRSDLLLRLTMLTSFVTITAVVFGVQHGILGVAIALALSGAVNVVPTLLLGASLLGGGVMPLVRQLVPGALVALGAWAGASAAEPVSDGLIDAAALTVESAAGLLAGLLCLPLADRACRTGLIAAARDLLKSGS